MNDLDPAAADSPDDLSQYHEPWLDDDDPPALVYTMRDLNQQTARIMSEVEKTGTPAFITRHGQFIAVIRPLASGLVESRVLAAMAREIGKREEA